MDEPTAVEPTLNERARRVHRAVFERVANTPRVVGAGVSEAILVEEAEREMWALQNEHNLERDGVLAAHAVELEEERQAAEAEQLEALRLLRQAQAQTLEQLRVRHRRELEAERSASDEALRKLSVDLTMAYTEQVKKQLEAQSEKLSAEHEKGLTALRDAHALELAVLSAALREARARSTQVGPVTGSAEEWRARLSSMPPLAAHEIRSWMDAALKRLGLIGTTQADVMIVRMALLLLSPYTKPDADAETT